MSHKISAISASLLEEVIRHDELQSVSLDCAMRCCLPVLGQALPRSSKQQKKNAAFSGDQAFTRVPCSAHKRFNQVLTVQGRTNAVLLLRPLPGVKPVSLPAKLPWSHEEWAEWCQDHAKASLPLYSKRTQQQAPVKRAKLKLKRPAANLSP